MNELSLFSGYGGFSLGLRLAGLQTRTVAYVEWEKYPQEILKARIKDGYLDDAPIFADISSFRGEQFRGMVDIITAGFPCQPHSVAGLQRGANDDRNKWPDTLRVIREVGPRIVVLENVPGLASASKKRGTPAYGGTVVGELASLGYSVHWQTLGAGDVGAPHRRKRWWCIGVADSEGECSQWFKSEGSGSREPQEETGNRGRDGQLADSTKQGLEGVGNNGHQEGWQEPHGSVGLRSGAIPVWPPSPSDTDGWERVIRERPDLSPALTKEAEPQFRGVVDGRSRRVDELKALGNGIVPAVLAEFLHRVLGPQEGEL